jgi:RNA polymerase sigma-70 factor (ECF subfamily)
MEEKELIPNLFRSEYQKIISVLCRLFGIQHIGIAEDIASDTFLAATEAWAIKGVPDNPTAWLYTVAKNKTKNYFKRTAIYEQKVSPEIKYAYGGGGEEPTIDLSEKNIADSQLAMIFTVCNPCNPNESQIALALNLLCGFGTNEISDAFLTNREVIYKRISRAKDRLKEENIMIGQPSLPEIRERLDNVLKTIYLLFSEGYYSTSQNTTLRQDLCSEAMRLAYLLLQNKTTDLPAVNALMALMCFHTSRFGSRVDGEGHLILYRDQDETLWNGELIARGAYYLGRSSTGGSLSKYHLEAGIAYWHTQKEDNREKWENIMELYNNLILLDPSPLVALNRTFVLSKIKGREQAILEAEKLQLNGNQFYHSLLGHLHTGLDKELALAHYGKALSLARTTADQNLIKRNIGDLEAGKYK